jgi:uncharacterized coiled-coil protein SlyX
MTEPELQQRLDRIESSIAHLERLYEQLNEVVIQHSESFRRLQTQLQRVTTTIENAELDRIRSTDPRPPHHQ